MGVFGHDHEGMSLYKINPEARTTILVYKNRTVESKMVDYDAKKDQAKLVKLIDRVVE
jgi:hypothetical protein